MPENTQSLRENSTSNTYKPASDIQVSLPGPQTCAPPVPDKIFDLGQNSSTTSSFTQMKVLKQWGQMGHSPCLLDQNIDIFMSRLHELFKQGDKFPHKSEQHTQVNASDIYCPQPTAVTSDFTAMSAPTYNYLQEEQVNLPDIKPSHLVSVHAGKKSRIPVRSASQSCYTRRSLTDTFVRRCMQELDLAERMSSTVSDVANISALPTDSCGSGITRSYLPKTTANLHSQALMKTRQASLTGQERRPEKTQMLNSLRTMRTKVPVTTRKSKARWRNHSITGTDGILRPWHKLSCGDSSAGSVTANPKNTASSRAERPNTFIISSNENDSLVQCFYRPNQKFNTNPSSREQTTIKYSADSLSHASVLDRQKSFTNGLIPKDKQAATTSRNSTALNVINSMKQENLDAKKQTQGCDEMLVVAPRRPLGPRSRSCIPVRQRTASDEKPAQHHFKHSPKTLNLDKLVGTLISTVISHQGGSNKRNTLGKRVFIPPLTASGEPTVDVASSTVQSQVQEVKTNKPPLPMRRFRSNMSSVKPFSVKSTPKRELSIKTSFPEIQLQTSSPPSLITSPQKGSPCAMKTVLSTEFLPPKQSCKQQNNDSSAFWLLSNGCTSLESLRMNAQKSSPLTASHQTPCQVNQQTSYRNRVQQPALKSAPEPLLNLKRVNGKTNEIISRSQFQPAKNDDKKRQLIRQKLVKTTLTNNVKSLNSKQPKQKQSKQIELRLSPKTHQMQEDRGDKVLKPTLESSHDKNIWSHDKKTKGVLFKTEDKTHKNNNELQLNNNITELQKSGIKSPKNIWRAGKVSNKGVMFVKAHCLAVQPQENVQSPTRTPISKSPNEKTGRSCLKEKNSKYSVRSKGVQLCERLNNNKVSPRYQTGRGRQPAKNGAVQDAWSQPACSTDKLSTDSSTSDTDCEPTKTRPRTKLSSNRSHVARQESEVSKKVHERDRKGRSVEWNTSESRVLIHPSRQSGPIKAHALADNKTSVRTNGSFRDSTPAVQRRASPEGAQDMPRKLNKHMSSPQKSEPKGHVDCALLSSRMVRTHSDQPQEGRGKLQTLAHQNQSAVDSDLDKQLVFPVQNCIPSKGDDQDDDDADDDKIIQADLEETLIQLYKTQNNLHLRVITLQDTIKQLRAGLVQESPKAVSERDFQWEGTLYDYFMLLGFMVVQFCIQYIVMNR